MKKILIVVDMQKDFVDGALGSQEAVAIVDNVTKKIEGFDGDIIVTYDTHEENYMHTQEGKKLPVPHCIKGTEGWALDKKVQQALTKKEYHTIEKPTFGSTDLPLYIKGKYNGEKIVIELIGLCTDICVVSNALLLKASRAGRNFTATLTKMTMTTATTRLRAFLLLSKVSLSLSRA